MIDKCPFHQRRVQEPSFADISASSREAKGDPGDHKKAGCQVEPALIEEDDH